MANSEAMVTKKLYRSRTDSMIGGVCGGLAEYFGVDSTLVRLVAVALTLAWGSGLLAYIIFWIVVPQKPIDQTIVDKTREKAAGIGELEAEKSENSMGVLFVGVLLVVLGFIFLAGNFLSFAWLSFRKLWPLVLIAVGVFILLRGTERKAHES